MRFRLFVLLLLSLANARAQWVTLNPDVSVSLNGVQMFDEEGWVAGDQGAVYHLTNKGFVWTLENSGIAPQDRLTEICFVNENSIWAVGTLSTTSSGKVYRRASQGAWETRPIPSSPELLAIACVRGSSEAAHLLWTVGSSNTVLHSSNSGTAFVALNSTAGSTYRDVAFVDRNRGWIVGNSGVIISTSNGGQRWSDPLPTNTTDRLEGVYFANATRGWAVGSNGTIITTGDGGASWQPQPSHVATALNAITGIDDNHLIAAGFNGTVLSTSNGGQPWAPEITGFATTFNAVAMIDTMNIWLVGVNGANVFSLGKVRFKNRKTTQDTIFAGESYLIDFSSRFINRVDIFYRTEASAPPQFIRRDYLPQSGPVEWEAPPVNSAAFELRIRPSDTSRDTLGAADAMVFKVIVNDRIPPQFSQFAVSPPLPLKGEDIRINVHIVDRHSTLATLYYRRGGSQGSYTPIPMALSLVDSTRYEATIPGFDLTLRGIQYYIEAIDGSVFQNSNSLHNAITPGYLEVSTNNEAFHVVPSTPGAGEKYQMISIPLDLGVRKSISQVLEVEGVLGQYDPAKWRLFRWIPLANNGNGEYQEYKGARDYPALGEVTFEPGRAFWLALSSVDTLNTGAGHSISPIQAVLNLRGRGWHQVANPYAYEVRVADIEMNALLSDFSEWNPDSKMYDRAQTLKPYEGYFVRSEADSVTLPIPAIAASNSNQKIAVLELDGSLKLSAEINGDSKTLLFGHSSLARDQYDRFDWLEPPLPFNPLLHMYIPHADWPHFAGNYREDVRATKTDGEAWKFVVECRSEGRIKFHLNFEGSFARRRAVLIPLDTYIVHEIASKTEFEYFIRGDSESTSFLLLTGAKEFLEAQIDALKPERHILAPNFPNPFNPATAIRFGLPRASVVTMQIYDVLGREVRTLLRNRSMTPGFHVQVWDGKDGNGSAVASGVYFYRLRAEDFSQTRKMMLTRNAP